MNKATSIEQFICSLHKTENIKDYSYWLCKHTNIWFNKQRVI